MAGDDTSGDLPDLSLSRSGSPHRRRRPIDPKREQLQVALTRFADGDREAFGAVFEGLWPVLRGFAARQLPAAEAEDVAQKALIKVFEKAGRFDRDLDALTWSLGIAGFEIRTHKRRARRRREEHEAELLAALPDGAASPEDEVMLARLQQDVVEVVGTLKPQDVETLRALLSGRRPSVPGATFRKRLERALGRFRTTWSMKHGR
jgi:RNA polymerase sigma factor (sigma-70 family)